MLNTLFPKIASRHSAELDLLLAEFNRSLMLIADKELLIRNFLSKVRQFFPVERLILFLPEENTGKFKEAASNTGNRRCEAAHADYFPARGKLVSWLAVNERPLIISRHTSILAYLAEEERGLLQKLKAEVVYPLLVMNRISGILLLGKKLDGKAFGRSELERLSLLLGQAAFAIEHATLYELQRDRLKRMYRTDRLAVLGELAAGAAHEIKNPLTSIRSTIQYLSRSFDKASEQGELMNELLNETERINKIVQGLLSFARPGTLNMTEVDLEQLVNQALLLTGNTLRKQQIEVEFEYFTDRTTIHGDADQLKQVCLNILLNAVEAMQTNPPERPRTLYISIEEGTPIDVRTRYLLLSFEDTGPGISEEQIDDLFTPFFTTKEEGTGLGLAICYGIVSRHQGEIEVHSTPGHGACFTLKLPQRF